MNTLSYKTVSANKATVNKEWIVIDASENMLGRLSSRVAKILRGKHKTNFTPHVDCGDNVIIVNADKIKLSGKKLTDRTYFSHTGYPGGQVIKTPEEILKNDPARLVEKSIKGMLPRTRLGRQQFRNLYVYTGNEHPHQAQNPKNIDIKSIK
ncbi:MAG: 50S ribosomal protein L13 [Bacteroidota bacterium]